MDETTTPLQRTCEWEVWGGETLVTHYTHHPLGFAHDNPPPFTYFPECPPDSEPCSPTSATLCTTSQCHFCCDCHRPVHVPLEPFLMDDFAEEMAYQGLDTLMDTLLALGPDGDLLATPNPSGDAPPPPDESTD